MKALIFATLTALAASSVAAQETHSTQANSTNPAIKDSTARTVAKPARGHSSFTENQAKGRLTKAGYTNIGKLQGTRAGAWQGTATKNGKSVTVTLDYKGNITER